MITEGSQLLSKKVSQGTENVQENFKKSFNDIKAIFFYKSKLQNNTCSIHSALIE